MARNSFHLGIDYGTSASKLVLRDNQAPGGDRAEVVPLASGVRHSSCVTLLDGELFFGTEAEECTRDSRAVRYDSVKMRVAAEAKLDPSLFTGTAAALPAGMKAKHLAILSVWQLVSAAHRHAQGILDGRGEGSTGYALAATLGIPTSFFEDRYLRRIFWEVLEGALFVHRTNGNAPARLLHAEAASLAAAADNAAQDADMPDDPDELRLELRPEAEAALWWPIRSPAVPVGPYIEVDVGAGTT